MAPQKAAELHETLIQLRSASNAVVLACNKLLLKLERRIVSKILITKFKTMPTARERERERDIQFC